MRTPCPVCKDTHWDHDDLVRCFNTLVAEREEDRAAIRAYRKQHNHEFRDVVDCESGVCACYICLEHAAAIARAQAQKEGQ